MNKGSYFLLSNGDFPATPAHAPSFNLQGHFKGAYIYIYTYIYPYNDRFGAHLACPVLEVLVKRSRSVGHFTPMNPPCISR